MIVHEAQGVTLVGGAAIGPDDLSTALCLAPSLVAADGGAIALWAAGLTPLAVIGDMDSLADLARAGFSDRLHTVAEQETTDFEKCLTRITAPLIVGIGFLGGRLDHTLAVFNTLARHASHNVVLLGEDDCCCLLPPRDVTLALPSATRASFFPLGASRIWSQGLRWDLRGQDLAPEGAMSISNETADERVSLRTEGPVVAILPRAFIAALAQALTDAARGQ